MKKYFVCSDIHGFFKQFKKALDKNGFDIKNPNHFLIVLGDFEDRGQEALKVLKFLIKIQKAGRLILIRGNHEELMYSLLQELIVYGRPQGHHHYSNGTVGTIEQLTKDNNITFKLEYWEKLSIEDRDKINKALAPWKRLVETAVNYYEKGDYIFVHGWIPFKSPTGNEYNNKIMNYYKEWRDLPDCAEEWGWARWAGFPTAYKNKCYEPGKTIVCGHWACSAYWGDIKHERKPFPPKNRKDWEKSFEPAITTEFIAIDGCTAYSGLVNVLVFDEDENGNLILTNIKEGNND